MLDEAILFEFAVSVLGGLRLWLLGGVEFWFVVDHVVECE